MNLNQKRFGKLNVFLKNKIMELGGKPLLKELDQASQNLEQAQQTVLLHQLQYAKDTQIGKKYRWDKITSVREFQDAFPISTYEDFRPYIQQMQQGKADVLFPGKPRFYVTTSGTTAQPKYIPISDAYYHDLYSKQSRILYASMLQENPKMLSGYNFSVVSKAVEGVTEDGTPYGAMSGHIYLDIPGFLKSGYSIPYPVFEIEDYNSRYYCMMRFALEKDVTYLVSVNPTSILQLNHVVNARFEDLIADIHKGTLHPNLQITETQRSQLASFLTPNPKLAEQLSILRKENDPILPKHYWQNLVVRNSWANGNCRFYHPEVQGLLPDTTQFREFGYQSSEIRAGVSLSNEDYSSVLMCHLAFFEFIKVTDFESQPNPRVYLSHELELRTPYYLVFTAPNGLYRYHIHDIIEVTGYYNEFPKIIFLQKGKGVVSLTGEKLYESQVFSAVEQTGKELNLSLRFFVGFGDLQKLVYTLYVECFSIPTPDRCTAFQTHLDHTLGVMNQEYQLKRASGRLAPIQVRLLPRDSFDRYKMNQMKNGKHPDAQFKMIHLMQDETKLKFFERLAQEYDQKKAE
jgi:hypothetical protein